MSAPFVAVRGREADPEWHDQFLASIMPVVQVCARIRFRDLPHVEQEEAVAEAVAAAMISFVRLVERGKNPVAFAGSLARVAVLRVFAGRLSGSADSSRDVLSRRARQEHGFSVASLDAPADKTDDVWKNVLVESRKTTPADIAASRIDFAEWLGRMSNRRREIAEALAAGYRTEEVAERFNLSHGRISQLRRVFEDSWREFQRESPRLDSAQCPAAA
jgi:hypothetical protein